MEHTPRKKSCRDLILRLRDNFESTKFFQELTQCYTEGVSAVEKELKATMDKINQEYRIQKQYDDTARSLEDDATSTANEDKKILDQKFKAQKRLYKKVTSIEVRENELFFFITDMVRYGLSEDEKNALLQKYSAEAEAEVVIIAGKKHLMYKVAAKIPPHLESESNAYYKWILKQIRNNALVAQIIAAEWASDQTKFRQL